MTDPAATYDALRAETARMLGLDLAADLSPADGLRLDLCALLRLSLDALQGVALSGREVDLSRLQSCYTMLSKLLPQAVEAPQVRESSAARRRLAELWDAIAEVQDLDRDEKVTALEAEVAQLNQVIAGKDATILALGGATVAAASPPPPAPSPTQTSPQPPPNASPPRHYLCREDGFSTEGGRGVDRWSNRQ
jgi:hypothetical protein